MRTACWLFMILTAPLLADETPNTRGHLIIIGGGLRLDNRAVFEKLIDLSGGKDHAKIVILPTASYSTQDSHLFAKELGTFGIPPARAQVLDVTEHTRPRPPATPPSLSKSGRHTACSSPAAISAAWFER